MSLERKRKKIETPENKNIEFFEDKDGEIGEIVVQGSLFYQNALELTFTNPKGLKTFLLFLKGELRVK